MRCGHPKHRRSALVWRIGGGDIPTWFTCASFETPDIVTCDRCGETLSLGEANDSDPRVAIEVRAAEIAASGRPPRHDGTRGRGTYTGCERCGWGDVEGMTGCGKPSTDAGYLARCIVEHGETP